MSEVEDIGAMRQAQHPNGTPRFFADPETEDRRGALGEYEFEKLTGLQMDREARPDGDSGVDFVFTLNGRQLTIDVKVAMKPFNLLLKEKEAKRAADILVLGKDCGDRVEWLGWEHKSIMQLMPTKDFGYGIVNHYRAATELRPMSQLFKLIRGEY